MSADEVIDAEQTKPDTAIVQQQRGALAGQADLVASLEQRLDQMERVCRAVVRTTKPSQWQIFGDSVYMEADAALTIARGIGLHISAPEYEYNELGGGAVQCQCTIRVELGGREFEDIGDCDTFDEFLKKRKKDLEDSGAVDSQIHEALILELKKKAKANALSRAVSGWIGVRGLTPEEMQELGLNIGKVKRTVFNKGTKGGKVQTVGSVKEIKALAQGSVVSFVGQVTKVEQKHGRNGPYCWVYMTDAGGVRISLTWWHPPVEWLKPGAFAIVSDLTVGNYQGKPSYSAKTIEESDPPAATETTNEQPADADANRGDDPEAY
jgi:hypothetical protein